MTRQILVGGVPLGGGAPVTIQSMCNTRTDDVEATVAQIGRLAQAGCQIVRVAVPDREAAHAIGAIKERIPIPLVADIHFDYHLALEAVAAGVDKVRINPGNIGGEDRVKAVAGACRVHGGGFAGTIQAFVPLDMKESFRSAVESVLGEGSCHILSIRPDGGTVLAG